MSQASTPVASLAGWTEAFRSLSGVMRWTLRWLPLVALWALTLAIVVPTITASSDDPNLIIYFNSDEGGTMDLLWSYYSGERRDSFQWDLDYGLEMVYLADVARFVLRRFMVITPVTLIALLRWLHLVAWLAALGALWRLVGRHVARGWPQVAAVAIMAVRPALDHLVRTSQPEPLVLLFMLLGLDATLRLVEQPSWRWLGLATGCAAAATVVKYAGVFLLPAIVAAMVFGHRQRGFPVWRASWLVYVLAGLGLIMLTSLGIIGYVRHSTGMTWAAQYGFWGSLRSSGMLQAVFGLGLGVMGVGVVCRWLRRFTTVNSYTLWAGGWFLGWMALLGWRWWLEPSLLMNALVHGGSLALTTPPAQQFGRPDFWAAWGAYLWTRLAAFDPLILLLLATAVVLLWSRRVASPAAGLLRAKQVVLGVLLGTGALLVGATVKLEPHHLLPFVAAAILAWLLAWPLVAREQRSPPRWSAALVTAWASCVVLTVAVNGAALVTARLAAWRRSEDVVFDFARWWRQQVPLETVVVADHYRRVYVPAEYSHLTVFKGYEEPARWLAEFRQTVRTVRPELIYYNTAPVGEMPVPPIETMLPDLPMQQVAVFDSAGRASQRMPGDRVVVYRVVRP